MADSLLLTVPEACGRLHLGKTFVYENLIRTGRLPVIRLGRAVRVSVAAVERLVEELNAEASGATR